MAEAVEREKTNTRQYGPAPTYRYTLARTTVTAPAWMLLALRELGGGAASTGLQRLVDAHADPGVVSMARRAEIIAEMELRANGLGEGLTYGDIWRELSCDFACYVRRARTELEREAARETA